MAEQQPLPHREKTVHLSAAAAHENAGLLRLLLQEMPSGVIVCRPDLTVSLCNALAAKLLGLTQEEILGKAIRSPQWHVIREDGSTLPPEEYPATRVVATGEPYSFIGGICKPDGSVTWLLVNAKPIRHSDGSLEQIVITLTDISERNRGIQELRISEQQYRATFNAMSEAMNVVDTELRLTTVNEVLLGWCRRQGFSTDLIGRTVREAFPFLPESVLAEFRQVFSSGKPVITEERYSFEGKEQICEVRKTPVFEQGRVTHVVTVISDSTERRQLEQRLKESEAKYRMLAEASRDLIFIIDGEDRITFTNQCAAACFGRRPEELVGKSRASIFPPQVAEAQGKSLKKVWETGEPLYAENPAAFPHGERWLGTWLVPLKSANGAVHSVLGFSRDITERKQLEILQRETNARLLALIEAAPVAILALDPAARIVAWNPGAERLFGWSAEEALGGPMPYVTPEKQAESRELIGRLARGESLKGVEVRRQKKDGTPVDVSIWTAPLHDANNAVVGTMGVMLDVTERKSLEAQLLQSQKMEAIGQLAGGVAHDFNNLLAAIMGRAELMLTRLAADAPAARDVQAISEACVFGRGLTSKLLAFARKQAMQPAPLDLNVLITDLMKVLRYLLNEDIAFSTMLAPQLWPVKADPSQLQQVLLNLVVNARDAMPRGGKLSIETMNLSLSAAHITSSMVLPPGQYVQLCVSDSGIGMDAHTAARIFEPFFTTKDAGRGVGLGLSTAYGIVKQLGGAIEVQSQLAQGAVFRIYLPRTAGEVPATPQREVAPAAIQVQKTILVVEDDESVRSMVQDVLVAYGYAVVTANHGKDALEVFRQHQGRVQLLLTDVLMPEMNGPDLAKTLGAEHPELKVLYMSGYTDEALSDLGISNNGLKLLMKPFSNSELIRCVREAVGPR